MSRKFTTSIAAALFVGAASFAMNAPAAAAFRHGGGGGFHGGGFHGGGFHGGGFDGGGLHFGGGHFGGFHFAMRHFGGFGHARFAFHRSFGGAHAWGHPTTRYAAGRPIGASAAGARVAGAESARFGAADHVGSNREAPSFQHGQFGRRDFQRGYVGWGGPVFWPYAYDDLFDYSFWPYAYDGGFAPFWAYGYDDLFAGVLLPYAALASNGATPAATAQAAPRQGAPVPASSAAQLCVSAQSAPAAIPIDLIAKTVQPTSDQSRKLDALKSAEAAAEKPLSASCGTQTPATAVARLDAVQARLQNMIEATDIVRAPLDDFYASLTDEQKARFDTLGESRQAVERNAAATGSLARLCGPQTAVPVVSTEQIDKAVQPDAQQRADLASLSDAANKADQMILASCPAQQPLTPPGRLAAVRNRLEAMLHAVETVRPALQSFYASLGGDQKAHFNAINEQVATTQTTPKM